MQQALDQFNENIRRANHLAELASSLFAMTTPVIDVTDIYRATVVQTVSALDQFIHEIVRIGMLQSYRGIRPVTASHSNFRISLSSAKIGFSDANCDTWLDQAIRDAHSWKAFQHPDKIAEAISLIFDGKLWVEVAKILDLEPKALRAELITIVDRRNKIAHEADIDPTNPDQQWPINADLVSGAVGFIERLVVTIFKVIAI